MEDLACSRVRDSDAADPVERDRMGRMEVADDLGYEGLNVSVRYDASEAVIALLLVFTRSAPA